MAYSVRTNLKVRDNFSKSRRYPIQTRKNPEDAPQKQQQLKTARPPGFPARSPAHPPLPITSVCIHLVHVPREKSEISQYGGNGNCEKLRNCQFAGNVFVHIPHFARNAARVYRGAKSINPRWRIRIMGCEFHISRESRTRGAPKVYSITHA